MVAFFTRHLRRLPHPPHPVFPPFLHQNGGYGEAPKWLQPLHSSFLIRFAGRTETSPEDAEEALAIASHSLTAAARGGLHDQIGGGFHPYAVDAGWHVPHWEKMAYDQALMASAFVEAAAATGDGPQPTFADLAHKTLAYACRVLRDPATGAFRSSQSSLPAAGGGDGEGGGAKAAGEPYLWTEEEIDLALEDPAVISLIHWMYGVEADGNAAAHPGKNVLHVVHPLSEAETEDAAAVAARALDSLREVRDLRPQAPVNARVVTAWHSLMISALVRAHILLPDAGGESGSDAYLATGTERWLWLLFLML